MKDWNDDDDDDDGDGVHQVRVVVNWKDDDKFRTERTDSPPLHLLHHSLTLSRSTRVSVLACGAKKSYDGRGTRRHTIIDSE